MSRFRETPSLGTLVELDLVSLVEASLAGFPHTPTTRGTGSPVTLVLLHRHTFA